MSILQDIIEEKKREISIRSEIVPLERLIELAKHTPKPRGFRRAILEKQKKLAIIAEIKRASPSKGIIREDLDPPLVAEQYQTSGAACLSVLTDERFFKGRLDYIQNIRMQCPAIPVLRKDFIIDRYQVWESRNAGADAVLLIVAALDKFQLEQLYFEALVAELDVLIEVHTKEELLTVIELLSNFAPKATRAQLPLVGINNRDLHTFVTDIELSPKLVKILQTELELRDLNGLRDSLIIVAESGFSSGSEIKKLRGCGIDAFLIGESLLRKGDPGENLRKLIADAA